MLPLGSMEFLRKWREQKHAIVNEHVQFSGLVEPMQEMSQHPELTRHTLGEGIRTGNEMSTQNEDNGDPRMLASTVGPSQNLSNGVINNLIIEDVGRENRGDHNVLDPAVARPEGHRVKRTGTASRVEWRKYF